MTVQQKNDLDMLIALAMHPAGTMTVFERGYLAGLNFRRKFLMTPGQAAAFAALCRKYLHGTTSVTLPSCGPLPARRAEAHT